MRLFIKYLLIFVLPLLVLIAASEILLRHIPNDYSYKNNYLQKHSDSIEVLYLGNSHTYFGLNPDYSKYKSFNAAHISQTVDYDLAILKKYENNWANLKLIVIPVDYFSLYTTLDEGIEKWRAKNYVLYYGIIQNRNYTNRFELLNGKFSYNMKRLRSYYLNGRADITSNKVGWGTTYQAAWSQDLEKTGKIAAHRHTMEAGDKLDAGRNMQTLLSLVEFANRKNVRLIFITCPAYRSYVENLNQQQLANTITLITGLTRQHTNTVYYNFLNDPSFQAEDFYDADHLDEKGAKKFTLLLDSVIKTVTK